MICSSLRTRVEDVGESFYPVSWYRRHQDVGPRHDTAVSLKARAAEVSIWNEGCGIDDSNGGFGLISAMFSEEDEERNLGGECNGEACPVIFINIKGGA